MGKRSLKLHPDKVGGSTEAFQELDRAYKVLSDGTKREEYDKLGLDLHEADYETVHGQAFASGLKVAELGVCAMARTCVGGCFVLLLPHHRLFRSSQGLVS